MKNKLAYYEESDEIFYYDKDGNEQRFREGDFEMTVLMWLNRGDVMFKGENSTRILENSQSRFEITVKRVY